jgi:hypothetical protein
MQTTTTGRPDPDPPPETEIGSRPERGGLASWSAAALWALRAAVVAGLCLTVLTLAKFPYDDAFIHLRVARNLALHGQPYFNLGEPVMADSSPLWLVLLAGASKAGFRLGPEVVAVMECVVVGALALVAERFLASVRGRAGPITIVAAASLAATALAVSGGLMESGLALVLLTGGAWALYAGRAGTAGVAFALAIATRFEMVIPTLVAFVACRDRKRFAAGAGLIGATELLLLLSAFGTFVPNSMRAKALAYHLPWTDVLGFFPGSLGFAALGAPLLVVASCIAGLAWWRARPAQAGIVAAVAALPPSLIAIYLAQGAFVFPWYGVLLVYPAGLAAWATAFLAPFRDQVPARGERRPRVVPWGALAIAAWGSIAGAEWTHVGRDVLAIRSGDLLSSPGVAVNARILAMARVGASLDHLCPDAVVMTPEIGALGWAFRGRIIDSVGLASPEMFPYYRADSRAAVAGDWAARLLIPARAVADLRPDVVVGTDIFFGSITAELTSFRGLSDYRVATLPWLDEAATGIRIPSDAGTLVTAARPPCANRLFR